MNIRDLEYLVAVAKHKSFVKAALECHVCNSLTGQIKNLKIFLGHKYLKGQQRMYLLQILAKKLSKAKIIIDKTDEIKSFHQTIKIHGTNQ